MGVKSVAEQVFIHRSIKTRIETEADKALERAQEKFLYIDPLKQGLKLIEICLSKGSKMSFYT